MPGMSHTVSFAPADTGLFKISLSVTIRPNFTARVQGFSLKGSTLEGISDTGNFSGASVNDIDLIGYVANASDSMDVQWSVKVFRRRLNDF